MSRFKHSWLPGEALAKDQLNYYYKEHRMQMQLGSCCDIDSIPMIYNEYKIENGKPKPLAIIEMKHGFIKREEIDRELKGQSPNCILADMAGLPYFLIRYFPEQDFGYWSFSVWPVNDKARTIMTRPLSMSNRRFVWFMGRLHGKVISEIELEQYNNALPPKHIND